MPKFIGVDLRLWLVAISAAMVAPPVARADDATVLREVRFPHASRDSGALGPVGPYYPERAYELRRGGAAAIACHVAKDGALNDCVVVKETGTLGFGDASLKMAQRRWIVAAPKADGTPEDPQIVQYFRVDFGKSK